MKFTESALTAFICAAFAGLILYACQGIVDLHHSCLRLEKARAAYQSAVN
jgi:hypothetical protein